MDCGTPTLLILLIIRTTYIKPDKTVELNDSIKLKNTQQ